MKASISLLILSLLFFASCEKFGDFENMAITEDSFTGAVSTTESAGEVDATFTGTNDSGAYGFIWDNPTEGAILNVEVFRDNGTVQFILEDSRGNEVLNALTSGESNLFSIEGKKGKWKVRMVFSDFEGEGSFDLNPVN